MHHYTTKCLTFVSSQIGVQVVLLYLQSKLCSGLDRIYHHDGYIFWAECSI